MAVVVATQEELDSLKILTETKDYKLVLLSKELREAHDSNYGIVSKEHGVVEAMYGVMFGGYQLITELQEKLDEYRPASTPVLSTVQ